MPCWGGGGPPSFERESSPPERCSTMGPPSLFVGTTRKIVLAWATMRTARSRPASPDVASRLASQVLVCDGAMGTLLHAGGVSLDRSLPELNFSNPDRVRSIHRAYIDAGAT